MVQKNLNNILILFLFLLIVYAIGTKIFYFSVYADFPTGIQKIENCKNTKIIDKAISDSKIKSNNINELDTKAIENFHHIKKFNSNGHLIDSWGVRGIGKGKFLHPHGIGSDSKDNLHVSDAVLCNIQKFNSNGHYLFKFGSRGNGPGEFLQPESIAIDKNDNVFVVDYATQHIQKFDSNGNFITMWGSLGCKNDQFLIPHDITIDPEGNIYVSDSGKVHFRENYTCN